MASIDSYFLYHRYRGISFRERLFFDRYDLVLYHGPFYRGGRVKSRRRVLGVQPSGHVDFGLCIRGKWRCIHFRDIGWAEPQYCQIGQNPLSGCARRILLSCGPIPYYLGDGFFRYSVFFCFLILIGKCKSW